MLLHGKNAFFCKNNKVMSVDNNCFLTSPLKLLFFIDLVINIHREFNCVFISQFYLVINILKTFA